MGNSEKGQVSASAAEVYEDFFIAALFGEWPARVIDAAGIQGGTTLQIQITETMAQVTSRLGIDMVPAFVPPESGWVAVAGRFITGARTWLTSAARGTVAALSRNPGPRPPRRWGP